MEHLNSEQTYSRPLNHIWIKLPSDKRPTHRSLACNKQECTVMEYNIAPHGRRRFRSYAQISSCTIGILAKQFSNSNACMGTTSRFLLGMTGLPPYPLSWWVPCIFILAIGFLAFIHTDAIVASAFDTRSSPSQENHSNMLRITGCVSLGSISPPAKPVEDLLSQFLFVHFVALRWKVGHCVQRPLAVACVRSCAAWNACGGLDNEQAIRSHAPGTSASVSSEPLHSLERANCR